jgi:hypothetical protein
LIALEAESVAGKPQYRRVVGVVSDRFACQRQNFFLVSHFAPALQPAR